MGASICKRCGASIIWLTMPDGKKIPTDVEKIEFITRGQAAELVIEKGRPAHWETCSNPIPIEEDPNADL